MPRSIDETHIGPSQFPHNPYDETTEIWKRQSLAYWAKEPNGTLVLFVHGWTGRALDTWTDFPGLWPDTHRGCDLLFYGYSSARPQIEANAAAFAGFLEQFMAVPEILINQTLPHLPALHRRAFRVEQLIIVAHSLGAVIVRDALLRIKEKEEKGLKIELEDRTETGRVTLLSWGKGNNSWLLNTKLVLFAPAHCGSKLAEKFSGRALARGIGLWALHSVRDLSPKCDYLVALQQRTETAVKEGWREPFRSSRIVFPYVDDVVLNGRFPDDPLEEQPFYGKTHGNVCKPSGEWPHPVKLVENVL
ncbi:MAG: alpha/beta hydrolase [Nitrospira sp.]